MDGTKGAIVGIQHPLPEHEIRIQRRVFEVKPIVEHGGDQIVRGGDGMKIPVEMEIDLLHRDHRSLPATGGTTLSAENGPHRGLPQSQRGTLSQMPEPLSQSDRRRRFALTRRGRSDRTDQDHPPSRRRPLHVIQTDFGPIPTVGFDLRGRNPQLIRNRKNVPA